jgi:medium-chain acyl-[acyl-carrier-protein] hydrolase
MAEDSAFEKDREDGFGCRIAEKEASTMVPPAFREERTVEAFEVDVNGRLRPYVLFSLLLNSAWKHASSSGFSYQELSSRKLMWILSKFQLSVEHAPAWGDPIIIETWGKNIERFFALRDFQVSSPQGRPLASATGAWMILDKDSYRPQKLEQLMESFPWQKDRSALQGSLKKVAELTGGQQRMQRRVRFSDLDMNNHVNAARYLQWVMDSYPLETLGSCQVQSVEISFLAEAMAGDEISVHFAQVGDHEISVVRRVSDAKDLCRAAIGWRTGSPD